MTIEHHVHTQKNHEDQAKLIICFQTIQGLIYLKEITLYNSRFINRNKLILFINTPINLDTEKKNIILVQKLTGGYLNLFKILNSTCSIVSVIFSYQY